jgi:phosphoribosylformylglycinamidine cyclo-ligase
MEKNNILNYETSGVTIENGNRFVNIIKNITNNQNIGGFSGIFEYNGIKLVASTDGVGTKLKLCEKYGKYDTIGIDLVAMCVNDIICQGAKPLFFLDYYAMGKLDTTIGSDIIQGIHNGCQKAHCILLGGETAEMPCLYKDKDFDLSGFSVGIIEGETYPKLMEEGDKIYGIKSSGIHSNGYSLINRILEIDDYEKEILMEPTKIYVDEIEYLKGKYKTHIKGFSHITGGGLIDNIPRVINEGFSMEINKSWKIPEVFQWIYKNSDMSSKEMLQTYNCGIGMVVIFDKDTTITDNLIELGKVIKSKEHTIDFKLIEGAL